MRTLLSRAVAARRRRIIRRRLQIIRAGYRGGDRGHDVTLADVDRAIAWLLQ